MIKLFNVINSIYNKLYSFNIKGFDYYYNNGVNAYKKTKYEKALKYFYKALEQKQIKPQVYYNLALTLQHLKDYDNAIKNYNTFLQLKPDDYDGLYNLALIYYQNNDVKTATLFLEKCVNIKIEENGIKTLIQTYIEDNNLIKVLDLIKNLLNKNNIDINIFYKIGKIFENKNYLSKDFTYTNIAIDIYNKIIEKNNNFFEAYISISICYAKKGEWKKSVDFCAKALKINPNSYEANNQMGLVYYCFNQIDEAIKYYETAFKLKPKEDYKIYSNLGYAYEKAGKYDKAIKIFNKLIRKFPQMQSKDEIKNHLRILKTA